MATHDDELWSALRQFEQAINYHEEWSEGVTRTVICRLPHDARDLSDVAHRNCQFGQWFHDRLPQSLLEFPAIAAVGVEHERMHRQASRVLLAASDAGGVTAADYDGFYDALERMRLQLLSLKSEVEDHLYNHDPLTGAGTRVGMLGKLRELWELSKRQVQTCCIALVDVDRFKTVNDTYGHPVGDRALAGVVHFLRGHLRPYDKVFRYGGEEFLVALPDCDEATAMAVLERIRERMAAAPMAEESGVPILLTASVGITELVADVPVETSIDRADAALYEAKAAGRNRVRAWVAR